MAITFLAHCPPHHPTHLKPLSLELKRTLRCGKQHPAGPAAGTKESGSMGASPACFKGHITGRLVR